MNRKLVVVPLGAISVLLAFASLAWACTQISGSTTVNVPSTGTTCSSTGGAPCSAHPGDAITATGSNAPAPATYWVHFLNYKTASDGHSCMGLVGGPPPVGDSRISSTGTPSSGGSIGSTSATIPSGAQKTNAATGPAMVCFISGNAAGPDYNYGTNAAGVTIL